MALPATRYSAGIMDDTGMSRRRALLTLSCPVSHTRMSELMFLILGNNIDSTEDVPARGKDHVAADTGTVLDRCTATEEIPSHSRGDRTSSDHGILSSSTNPVQARSQELSTHGNLADSGSTHSTASRQQDSDQVLSVMKHYEEEFQEAAALYMDQAHETIYKGIWLRLRRCESHAEKKIWYKRTGQPGWKQDTQDKKRECRTVEQLDPTTSLIFVTNPDLEVVKHLHYSAQIPYEAFLSHAERRHLTDTTTNSSATKLEVTIGKDFDGSLGAGGTKLSYMEVTKRLGLILLRDTDVCLYPPYAHDEIAFFQDADARYMNFREDSTPCFKWHNSFMVPSVDPMNLSGDLEAVVRGFCDFGTENSIHGPGFFEALTEFSGAAQRRDDLVGNVLHLHLLVSALHLRVLELLDDIQEIAPYAPIHPNAWTLGKLSSIRGDNAGVQSWLRKASRSEKWSFLQLRDFDEFVLSHRQRRHVAVRTFAEVLEELQQRIRRVTEELNELNALLIPAITLQDSAFMKIQAERATTLTVLAAIYLPLTLVTGIFGMNIREIGDDTPWWIALVALAIIVAPTLLLFLFMRDRRRRTAQDLLQIDEWVALKWRWFCLRLRRWPWLEWPRRREWDPWQKRWAEKEA